MAVEPVQVEYEYSSVRQKCIQVSRLQQDGLLLVEGDPKVWIQSNPADLLSVRSRGLDIGQNHNPQSDDVKDNTTQKKEIPLERIQTLMSQKMTLVDAAKQLHVSRSTLKRKLKEYKLKWPSSRKRKQPQDARSKKKKTVEQFIDMPLTGLLCDVQYDVNAALKKIAQDLSLSTSLDSMKQPKSSSTFIVKATYNEDTIRFDFSLSSSIELLKEEVRKRLDVDIRKIKMKYLDEDNEWVLFKIISDLKDAQRFPSSTGNNIVKLLITISDS